MAVAAVVEPVSQTFFALRPVGHRVPALPRLFFERSMANSCWSSRAPVLCRSSLTRHGWTHRSQSHVHTTTTISRPLSSVTFLVLPFSQTHQQLMKVDCDGGSSAWRRRQRRLRSWWRHERMSIASAEGHHHAAPKVGPETEDRQCGDAAGSPEGSLAAGGSHGRSRA